MKKISLILVGLLIVMHVSAQKKDVLKVKKQQYDFLFYQADKKSDTIYPQKYNTFVLALPDSILFDTEIRVTNGRLSYNPRNSSFQLQFIPTMNYRHFVTDSVQLKGYEPAEAEVYKKSPKVFVNKLYVTQVNGSNSNTTRQIHVEFYNTKTGKVFLKNTFVFFAQ